MGFFSKLFGGTPARKDPFAVHPDLGPLMTALNGLDGRPALALFGRTRGRWDLRTWVVDLTAQHYFKKLPQPTIDSLVQQGEVGWLLARGSWHIQQGWAARGSGSGDTVTDEGGRELERRCRLAQNDLLAAAERDPQDPTGFSLMLTVAKGLGERELGEEMYARAIERDPMGYEPHCRFLNMICERWFGSHDEMLSRAREIAARAPDGSDAASLPIEAHYDRYSHLCIFDEKPDAAIARLRDPDVQSEITKSLMRSLDAPNYQPTASTLRIRHTAALLYYQGGALDAARAQLLKVGETLYKTPWWQNTDDAEAFYAEARKKLGLDR